MKAVDGAAAASTSAPAAAAENTLVTEDGKTL